MKIRGHESMNMCDVSKVLKKRRIKKRHAYTAPANSNVFNALGLSFET